MENINRIYAYILK
uniref:Uncharacterized protein n=1 Tax=Rhizophora mucronata TaxID=61149 RepID=A0A2P2NNK7_RHIMU